MILTPDETTKQTPVFGAVFLYASFQEILMILPSRYTIKMFVGFTPEIRLASGLDGLTDEFELDELHAIESYHPQSLAGMRFFQGGHLGNLIHGLKYNSVLDLFQSIDTQTSSKSSTATTSCKKLLADDKRNSHVTVSVNG